MPANLLVIINGLFTYAWERINGELIEIEQMPVWNNK
jgi:hypothetical protein